MKRIIFTLTCSCVLLTKRLPQIEQKENFENSNFIENRALIKKMKFTVE